MDPISVTNSLHFFPHSGPDLGNTGPGNMGGGVRWCKMSRLRIHIHVLYQVRYKKKGIYLCRYNVLLVERAPRCAYAYIRPCPHCCRVSKASGMKMLGICHATLWDLKIFRFSASSATDPWTLHVFVTLDGATVSNYPHVRLPSHSSFGFEKYRLVFVLFSFD